MAEQSLLTPEIMALVGVPGEPHEAVVTAELVRRAIETTWGKSRRTRPDSDVPPLVAHPLETDDLRRAFPPVLPVSILVGQEVSMWRAFEIGKRMTVTRRVAGVTERMGGRFGHSLLVRNETAFADDAGEIGVATITSMHYDPANGGGPGDLPPEADAPAPAPAAPPGSALAVGEEVTPLAVTPGIVDAARYCALIWNFAPFFLDREAARAAGMPDAVVPGPLRFAYLYRALEEWLGARGEIRHLRTTHRRLDHHGRPLLVTGQVTRVYEEDGTAQAEVALSLADGNGRESVQGMAMVELR